MNQVKKIEILFLMSSNNNIRTLDHNLTIVKFFNIFRSHVDKFSEYF
uniref:PRO2866 n=1 Tax=Homo sapiens TaxID=9606 RepID=Q9H362_HUMAN|nr:PRO2866 [Homo sapiens]